MSKVGKKPVDIPAGVTPRVEGQNVSMKGPKGELSFRVPDDVAVVLEGNQITVSPRTETRQARALWGTSRAQLNNIATGVSKGFEKKLEINGVGYKAAAQGKSVNLSLGYSHEVIYMVPAGITVVTPKPTEIVITGIDRQQVGQVAAEIRAYRGPEPYKGKGVKYEGEFIFRKEGKKK
ncbi:MAG: 50S ribosomal protein L6 [Rhabdaerophilum sp.]